MLPLRHLKGWRAAGLSLLLLSLIIALLPAFWTLDYEHRRWLLDTDKFLHAFGFTILALWFSGQYTRADYWRLGLGLVLFGGLIELLQLMISYRTAEWLDLAADGAGIVIGLVIASLGVGGWSMRLEQRLARS